jgi:hypothetical protein
MKARKNDKTRTEKGETLLLKFIVSFEKVNGGHKKALNPPANQNGLTLD